MKPAQRTNQIVILPQCHRPSSTIQIRKTAFTLAVVGLLYMLTGRDSYKSESPPLRPPTPTPYSMANQTQDTKGNSVTLALTLPLTIKYQGPRPKPHSHDSETVHFIWTSNTTITLGPDTTYGDFRSIVRSPLLSMDVSWDKYTMEVRALAKVKKHWWSRCQAVRVDANDCCRMLKGADQGTVKESKAICQYVGDLTAVEL